MNRDSIAISIFIHKISEQNRAIAFMMFNLLLFNSYQDITSIKKVYSLRDYREYLNKYENMSI